MKTFTEACAATFVRPSTEGPESEGIQSVIDTQERHASLFSEIEQSREIKNLVFAFRQLNQHAGIPVEHLLIKAFSMGCMVGMEMERQDDPKIEI